VKTVYDRTELVDHVIKTVKNNLFEGGLLVHSVLFAFLGNLRRRCAVRFPCLSVAFAGTVSNSIAAAACRETRTNTQ